eukprot:gnl/TRDRNA2_/TRDRNA2_174983_c0_seq1.p1 gnl/TRDRNA2_/TRDRNA2_174983_c0~~gnl/TRDRNA2_/TRDRNA2_174983_c0_seq1.p1  ORF type:complete len:332 (-),score=30.64 gnl/TRDRNA2_/TRDRNA2_174983_c0_seq1:151-1146(-)
MTCVWVHAAFLVGCIVPAVITFFWAVREFRYPHLVIVSEPGSGSRGLAHALKDLGLPFGRMDDDGDDTFVSAAINAEFLRSYYSGLVCHGHARNFPELGLARLHLQTAFEQVAKQLPAGVKWASKEPHLIYFLHLLDDISQNRTKIVLLARDPRDLCNEPTMESGFRDMVYHLMYKGVAVTDMIKWNFTDRWYGEGRKELLENCYLTWAELWSRVLKYYHRDSRFVVVRIEDLVMPEPVVNGPSYVSLMCVAAHAGLHPSDDAMLVALRSMHKYRRSYMGQKKYAKTSVIEDNFALRTSPPVIHDTMNMLGYRLKSFGLDAPTYRNVCAPY